MASLGVGVTRSVGALVKDLRAAGSVDAAAAVALAREIDAGEAGGAGLAACVKQLVFLTDRMREAAAETKQPVSTLDEIAARRAARKVAGG